MELTSLHWKFCASYLMWHIVSLGCADIVSCIMAALEHGEVKRTRRQIVNQLVHQELVEDRRLLVKKPPKKKKVIDDTCQGGVNCDALVLHVVSRLFLWTQCYGFLMCTLKLITSGRLATVVYGI